MMNRTRHFFSFFTYYILILSGFIFIIPVLLTLIEAVCAGPGILLDGFHELLFNCFPFYYMFWNSVLYSVSITCGELVISVLAAFAFQFAEFKGKRVLFILYLILMMMPLQVMILPNYIGLRDMRLLNTRMAIILPLIFSPFGVVVLRQYMREIDTATVEATRLETNSIFLILIHCILPQIKVCVAACSLFIFADMWNMVEQPMLYVNDDKLRTLSNFVEKSDLFNAEIMFPAAVMFMVPVLLCYMLFHEELKEGLKL